MDIAHDRTIIGSRANSRQAGTELPSLAQVSALSHRCVQLRVAVGTAQEN